jgi:hypothetical protein
VFEAALLVGGAFGARHALEADHVAAVATLVEDRDGVASTGAAWGVGHSIPVVALGAVFIAADLAIPSPVGAGMETVVAVVLVALGLRAIAGKGALGTALLRHGHGADGDGKHRHVRIGGRRIGFSHSHADEESFAVGVVHGFAGSGAVVVAMAAAAPDAAAGAGFLAGFAGATVVAMATAAWLCGRAFGRLGWLRVVAGACSVAVGLVLLYETVGGGLPV